MTIKELKELLNKTPTIYIDKIELKYGQEILKVKNFNNMLAFDYYCLNLRVIDWNKNNNILKIEVSKVEYLKFLKKYYE